MTDDYGWVRIESETTNGGQFKPVSTVVVRPRQQGKSQAVRAFKAAFDGKLWQVKPEAERKG
jgi:hypothetical protein